ncbi:MAG: sodium:proton antiporter [Chitinophagaceae bacterium]|nr:sodium:proton antiporter [Chitinophagaceae bacterium]MBP9103297.1 sodium:proton antiporter [Chitinophagaceae bacterium]
MSLFVIITILVVLTAAFAFINIRFLKLPQTIGMMIISLIFSLLLIVSGLLIPEVSSFARGFIGNIDFSKVLLDIMLSFLLFAGALHTDSSLLKANRRSITVFAIVGVLLSTLLVGALIFFFFQTFLTPVNFWYCLLFGALVAPTDPIAVLGILTKAGAPKDVEIKIVGESLFNDGIGVVLFLSLLEIITIGINNVSFGDISLLLVQEIAGGILFGWILGQVGFRLMKKIDHYQTEVLITLAIVMGGYMVAQLLHLSGPLAMVVAGLFTGSRSKEHAMSDTTELYVDKFWELIDVLMNAILFVLIGLELLTLEFNFNYLIAGLVAIPITLLSRYLSLIIPASLFKKYINTSRKTIGLMTWGGLKGGLSIAMALSLSAPLPKTQFVFMIYVIVIFSIIVQGLTVGKLIKKVF